MRSLTVSSACSRLVRAWLRLEGVEVQRRRALLRSTPRPGTGAPPAPARPGGSCRRPGRRACCGRGAGRCRAGPGCFAATLRAGLSPVRGDVGVARVEDDQAGLALVGHVGAGGRGRRGRGEVAAVRDCSLQAPADLLVAPRPRRCCAARSCGQAGDAGLGGVPVARAVHVEVGGAGRSGGAGRRRRWRRLSPGCTQPSLTCGRRGRGWRLCRVGAEPR